MELLLNTFWLLIALVSFFWWRRRFIRIRPALGFRALAPLLAFTCALAIVFPVISVTDDLHAQVAVTDDSLARRRSVSSADGAHSPFGKWKRFSSPALLSTAVNEAAFRPLGAAIVIVDPTARPNVANLLIAERAPPTF
jgi:hypothetical protein